MFDYFDMWYNYTWFKGRLGLKAFWNFVLVHVCVAAGIVVFSALVSNGLIFLAVYLIASIPPSAAAVIRRLHDTGQNGNKAFLLFAPVVGWLILALLWLRNPGAEGENAYGHDPLVYVPASADSHEFSARLAVPTPPPLPFKEALGDAWYNQKHEGRTRRKGFWPLLTVFFSIYYVFSIVGLLNKFIGLMILVLVCALFIIFVCLFFKPLWALASRRLHDIGMSEKLSPLLAVYLLNLLFTVGISVAASEVMWILQIVSFIITITLSAAVTVLGCVKGQVGDNEYGEDPRPLTVKEAVRGADAEVY